MCLCIISICNNHDCNSNDNDNNDTSNNYRPVKAFQVAYGYITRAYGSKLGTIQRRLAWPLRKDDTHTSRSV